MSAPTEAFGAWIRMLRVARGLSQDELEIRSGLRRKTVGRIERAEHEVRVGVVFALATALDVEPSDLFAFSGEGPTQQDLERVLGRGHSPPGSG